MADKDSPNCLLKETPARVATAAGMGKDKCTTARRVPGAGRRGIPPGQKQSLNNSWNNTAQEKGRVGFTWRFVR